MMRELIWSTMVMVVIGHSASIPKLNIEQFANVCRFFRTVQICGHEIDVRTQVDYNGRIIISFKVNIKPNESDDELCKCMWKYLNQQCWLKDVERKCIVKGTQMTEYLIGPPNPHYNALEPLPTETAPIASLGDIFKHFPELEVANHKCRPRTTTNANGVTCISIECKLTEQSPRPENVCKNILKWMNQCEWLGTFEHTCTSRAGSVVFEMTGK